MHSVNLDPTTKARIKMKLYRNVTNVPELRQRLINGELQCCMVKPSLIIDPLQVVIAANKAMTSEKLKTQTIFTEILFNLSISKNITQSLRTFSIEDIDTDILVVVIETNEENNESIFKNINCDESSLDELKDIVKIDIIKKIYKITDMEIEKLQILDLVISRIAAKDIML